MSVRRKVRVLYTTTVNEWAKILARKRDVPILEEKQVSRECLNGYKNNKIEKQA
jgi:hypothetical protein